MNKVILLGVSGLSKATQALYRPYVWSANLLSEQKDYVFKHKTEPYYFWSEDSAFVKDSSNTEYLPHLLLGTRDITVLEPDSPHRARVDVQAAVDANIPAVMMKNFPPLATPKDRETINLVLDTKFMILLPEAEDKSESRFTLMGWRPDPSSSEYIELRIVRDDMGECKLELVMLGDEEPEKIEELNFDQWDLLKDRHRFIMTIGHGATIMITCNGQVLFSGNRPFTKDGPGYFYAFEYYSDFQKTNVSEVHRVEISRTLGEI